MAARPIPDRETLLQRAAGIAQILDATAAESERQRTLCSDAVDALHDAGLFGLWAPREVGGFDVDLVTQVDVLTEVARADMSACWTLMIGTTVTSVMASRLPEQGLAEVFSGPRLPTGAGSLKPSGKAEPVEGGYRVTGRWGFGSGIHHASWIMANCLEARGADPAASPRALSLVVPIAEVEIDDDWHVAGLSGSGSSSYSVQDVFVPTSRVMTDPPLRGSARTGNPGPRLPIEHASVSLGGARRALDEVALQATTKHRLLDPQTVASKQAFHVELGRLEALWEALRAGVRQCAADTDLVYENPAKLPAAAAKLRAVCACATEMALEIGGRALRQAGAAAVLNSNVLQRVHRDLTVSAQHFMISDVSFEDFGKLILTRDTPGG